MQVRGFWLLLFELLFEFDGGGGGGVGDGGDRGERGERGDKGEQDWLLEGCRNWNVRLFLGGVGGCRWFGSGLHWRKGRWFWKVVADLLFAGDRDRGWFWGWMGWLWWVFEWGWTPFEWRGETPLEPPLTASSRTVGGAGEEFIEDVIVAFVLVLVLFPFGIENFCVFFAAWKAVTLALEKFDRLVLVFRDHP